jgi:LacI family transcriptional regulator
MTRPPRAPTRRPTMSDVAAHAGTSLKTVSRVVNGEPHVSPALADRVQDAIRVLGFRRDASARQLAMGAAGRLLGYVQVDAANPFFGAVARGLEEETRSGGYLLLTGSTDADPAREGLLLETLVEARVAGIVVAAAEGGDELLREEIAHGTPVVCVDRSLAGASCDTVTSSNRSSTREAAAHLFGLGHRRVAYLGGSPRVWTAQERRAGYLDAVADAGAEALVVEGLAGRTEAAEAVGVLLGGAEPPTAIVAGQDRLGVGLLELLHERGLQHRIAHVVFDDLPLAGQLDPAVAVVRQDVTELGRTAGRLLRRRLEHHPDAPTTTVVVDASFLPRASVFAPR